MGYPPIEELLPQAGNSIYKLVRMAANRAVDLSDGKPKMIENVSSQKVTTIALEEIRAKKLMVKEVSEQFKAEEAKISEGDENVSAG